MSVQQYEYKVISERVKLRPVTDTDKALEARLNYWGARGWDIFKLDTKAVNIEVLDEQYEGHDVVGVDLYIHAVAKKRANGKSKDI